MEIHVALNRELANWIILSGISNRCSFYWILRRGGGIHRVARGSIWTSPDSFLSVEKENILISYARVIDTSSAAQPV